MAERMNEQTRTYLEEIAEILGSLIDQKAIYSRAGGGNGSNLLQKYQNEVRIWSWCSYWEIYQRGKLIADANDDITAVTGTVAVAAIMMKGKCLEGYCIDDEYLSLGLQFEDDIFYIIFPGKKEDEDMPNWEINAKDLNVVYKVNKDLEITKKPYYSFDQKETSEPPTTTSQSDE